MKRNILLACITCFVLTLAAAGQTPTPTPEYSETEDPKPTVSVIPTPSPTGMTLDELRQKIKTEKIKDVLVAYDKFRDLSIVSSKPENIVGSWESVGSIMATGGYGRAGVARLIFVSVAHVFAGTRLAATPSIYILKFDATNADWMFVKGSNTIYILHDDQRLVLDVLARDSDIKVGGLEKLKVQETLAWQLSREQLQSLAAAKKVEIMVSGNERPREIKAKDRKGWQALLTITETKP